MTKGVVKVLVAKGGDLFQQKGGYLSVKRESVEEGEEIGLSRDTQKGTEGAGVEG